MRPLKIIICQFTPLAIWLLITVSSVYAKPFSFVVMSDSRGDTPAEPVNTTELHRIATLVAATDAKFVVFPGDLTIGIGIEARVAQALAEWRTVAMRPIYDSEMCGAKVYVGPGNHDMRQACSESLWQSEFRDLPNNGPAGEAYMTYSFDYENSHFIMLDTDRYKNHHRINITWLASDLAATKADHIFVFGHEPAYPVGPHVGFSLDIYPGQRDAFWQLLKTYNVDAYFCAHEHLYNHSVHDGIHQIITGTCGAPPYPGYGGDFYHYAYVTVEGPEVVVKIFDDSGSGIPRDRFQFMTVPISSAIRLMGSGVIEPAGIVKK